MNTLTIILTVLLLISCDDSRLYNQNFKNWNLDLTKISTKIVEKVNPTHQNVSKDQEENIKIAVIDNGVDYNHTLLRNRFVKDGSGKFLGYDFASDDNSPFPSSLDISLFAFQKDFQKNQIHSNHSPDPLLDIKIFNKNLMDRFHNNKELRETSLYKTFFKSETINIFGILKYYIHHTEINKLDIPEGKIKLNELFNLNLTYKNFVKVAAENKSAENFLEHFDHNKYNSLKFLRYLKDGNFVISQSYGFPRIELYSVESFVKYFEHISIIEGYDLLVNQLEVLTATKEFKNFYASFLNYHEFLNTKEKILEKSYIREDKKILTDEDYRSALDESHSLLHQSFLRFHYKDKLIYSDGRYYDLTNEKRDFCLTAKDSKFYSKRNSEFKDKKILKSRKKIENLLNLDFSELKFFKYSDCSHLEQLRDEPDYNAYMLESSKMNSLDRGTSVSQLATNGLNKDIKIVPLRIQTLSTFNGVKQNEELIDEHIALFRRFIKNQPKVEEFLKYYSNSDLEKPLNLLKTTLSNSKYISGLNIFKSLRKSFDYISKHNIKLVLIPFATHFQNIRLKDNDDPTESMNSLVFLTFIEFLKYEMRSAINGLNRETIIFVSAGNQGKLVDGTNDTVIPCDLSSSKFLDDLEILNFESSPANIICVESLAERKKFDQKEYYPSSSFSNKILSNVNVIKLKGEQISAAVSSTNCNNIIGHYGWSNKVKMNEYDELLMRILVLDHKDFFCNFDLRTKMKLNNGAEYATALAANYFLIKYIEQLGERNLSQFKQHFLEPINKCVKNQENDFCKDELIIDLNE